MTIWEVLAIVSIISSIVAVVLAMFAIWFAKNAEKETMANFIRTNDLMVENYGRTKDVLNEIDKRAAVTESTVKESQEKLLSTITSIINELVIPKKPNMQDIIAANFMKFIMENPEGPEKSFEMIKQLAEIGSRPKTEDK